MLEWIDDRVHQLGFWRCGPEPQPATLAGALAEVERRLGGGLPDEYRRFVSAYGDGMLGTEDLKVMAPIIEPCPWGQATRPEVFYGAHQGAKYPLLEQLDTYRDRMPKGVLPICEDAGGNQICLDVAGEFPGTVWFWDHEQRWFTEPLEAVTSFLQAQGHDTDRMSIHDWIRAWARHHPRRFDRPPDYMGMYRMATTFSDFLRSLEPVPYE